MAKKPQEAPEHSKLAQEDQSPPTGAVATGLADAQASAESEGTPPSTDPISFSMPDEAPSRFQMVVGSEEQVVGDDFKVVAPAKRASRKKPNARDQAELDWKAEQDAKRRAFLEKYMQANAEKSVPKVVVQPVPPAVAEQTRLEMEAGKRMNEHHHSLRGGPQLKPLDPAQEAREAKMVPVFRPSDYTQPPLTTAAAAHKPTSSFKPL